MSFPHGLPLFFLLQVYVASWLLFLLLQVRGFIACCCSSCCRCVASLLAVVPPVAGVWLHCLLLFLLLQVCGFIACCCSSCCRCVASLLAVVLPRSRWRRSFEASGRILPPGTRAGAARYCPVRRGSSLRGSLSGFFLIGYSSICQLFKFSYRLLHAKVFRGENIIKTLFSINYRGYFIIQAAHLTLNYSYFLHKTGRKHVENQ